MTVEYLSTPDDLNESNGEVISLGKLIADTIDDVAKNYREFERNLLSDDEPGELGENCDEIGNEEEQNNDVNEHDVHFDISNGRNFFIFSTFFPIMYLPLFIEFNPISIYCLLLLLY